MYIGTTLKRIIIIRKQYYFRIRHLVRIQLKMSIYSFSVLAPCEAFLSCSHPRVPQFEKLCYTGTISFE